MASHRKEQSVARGGLFNPPRVEYSKETQDLLKSKLNWVPMAPQVRIVSPRNDGRVEID